jgi:ComEC/Rec2-related protein
MESLTPPPLTRGIIEFVAISWTTGSIVGCQLTYPWWMWLMILIAATPWLVLAVSNRQGRLLSVVLACGLLAAGRAAHTTQVMSQDSIEHWVGASHCGPARLLLRTGAIRVDGQVDCDVLSWCEPPPKDSWHAASGTLVLRSYGTSVSPGSIIDVTGRIRTGLGRDGRRVSMTTFSQLHCHLIRPPPTWRRWLTLIRRHVSTALLASPLSSDIPQSAVSAIVLGYRDARWKKMSEPFRSTGTAHLLAVSGLHLAVLCGFVLVMMRWSGLLIRRGFFAVVLVTIMMLCVAQVRTPLFRAGFMVIVISILASVRWRLQPGSVLAIAALVIEYAYPRIVLDVGFQLSFGVVAGLVYLLPIWSHRVSISGLRQSSFGNTIRVTCVAWLVATPLAAHHFGMYSLIGIPATILLFPLVSSILIVGYLRILIFWWDWPSSIAASILNLLSDFLWNTVLFLDQIPGAGLTVIPPSWMFVVVVECVVIITIASHHRRVRLIGVCIIATFWLFASLS